MFRGRESSSVLPASWDQTPATQSCRCFCGLHGALRVLGNFPPYNDYADGKHLIRAGYLIRQGSSQVPAHPSSQKPWGRGCCHSFPSHRLWTLRLWHVQGLARGHTGRYQWWGLNARQMTAGGCPWYLSLCLSCELLKGRDHSLSCSHACAWRLPCSHKMTLTEPSVTLQSCVM